MKNKLTDGEILSNVIDVLGVSVTSFTEKLGYKTTRSIYLIINNETSLKKSLCYKIVEQYPLININYLLMGESPIKINKSESIGQSNVLGNDEKPSLETMPKDIRDIKNILQHILEKMD
tara:strand:- start:404 stop:760 length:357 start_codon:yes stop_codon:yes gene_type:complete